MNPNPTHLRELAERCEREEPSADLHTAIRAAIGYPADAGNYTTSLDAAVTLVPEHRSYGLAFSAAGPRALRRARLWDWRRSALALDPGNEWSGTGKTLPLALCAAALKARAALANKTCPHDYEAEDDKGWTCKLCGHQT